MVIRSINKSRSRGWIEIAAAILYCLSYGAVMRTRIMSRSYLSYKQVVYYVVDLVAGELIESMDEERRYFRTTAKGHEFLKAHERIQEIMPVNRRTHRMNIVL
jgi:predicted transcriptional regulator